MHEAERLAAILPAVHSTGLIDGYHNNHRSPAIKGTRTKSDIVAFVMEELISMYSVSAIRFMFFFIMAPFPGLDPVSSSLPPPMSTS